MPNLPIYFIGRVDQEKAIEAAIRAELGAAPDPGDISILTHGVVGVGKDTRWVGLAPVAGPVILKAPDRWEWDIAGDWLNLRSQFGCDMYANTSDLVAVRVEVSTSAMTDKACEQCGALLSHESSPLHHDWHNNAREEAVQRDLTLRLGYEE